MGCSVAADAAEAEEEEEETPDVRNNVAST
jgi:hypothetical protein